MKADTNMIIYYIIMVLLSLFWHVSIEKIKKKFQNDYIKLDDKNKNNTLNTIVLTRIFNIKDPKNDNNMNMIVDSVLDKINNLHNIPMLELISNGNFLITSINKQIQIEKDIFIEVRILDKYDVCDYKYIQLVLLSNKLSTSEIKEYILDVYKHYKMTIQNGLENKLYFFEQQPNPPKELTYTMREFLSSKSFNNMYGSHIKNIKSHVDFFIKNKDWYDKKGIVYHLCMLFHGSPGAGKSSCIKSIANHTGRHIFNINFKNIKTITQLKNIFSNVQINIMSNDNSIRKIEIPIDKRLYVLEEFDAISKKDEIDFKLTLAEILDCTIEYPGRMIIITTNHSELVDKSLLHPGRIDLSVYFDKANKYDFIQMYENFYDTPCSEILSNDIPDKLFTYAQLQQLLLKNFHSRENISNDILSMKSPEHFIEKKSDKVNQYDNNMYIEID